MADESESSESAIDPKDDPESQVRKSKLDAYLKQQKEVSIVPAPEPSPAQQIEDAASIDRLQKLLAAKAKLANRGEPISRYLDDNAKREWLEENEAEIKRLQNAGYIVERHPDGGFSSKLGPNTKPLEYRMTREGDNRIIKPVQKDPVRRGLEKMKSAFKNIKIRNPFRRK